MYVCMYACIYMYKGINMYIYIYLNNTHCSLLAILCQGKPSSDQIRTAEMMKVHLAQLREHYWVPSIFVHAFVRK